MPDWSAISSRTTTVLGSCSARDHGTLCMPKIAISIIGEATSSMRSIGQMTRQPISSSFRLDSDLWFIQQVSNASPLFQATLHPSLAMITAAITQVAANKLNIKTGVKCDLGSSHCYVAFSAFDCHIVTREPGSVVDSRLRVAKTSSPSPNSVMHDDPQ